MESNPLYFIEDGELKHYGVKGMKWGIRRYQPYQKGDGQKGKGKFVGNIKKTAKRKIDSGKRKVETRLKGRTENLKKMSDKELKRTIKRTTLENDLMRLSKYSSDDKKDYENRAKMSDDELLNKVTRLRLEDQLRTQAKNATSAEIEAGKKAVKAMANTSIDYLKEGQKPSTLALIDSAMRSQMKKGWLQDEADRYNREVRN